MTATTQVAVELKSTDEFEVDATVILELNEMRIMMNLKWIRVHSLQVKAPGRVSICGLMIMREQPMAVRRRKTAS